MFRREGTPGMRVTDMKQGVKRQEWQEKIMECRSSGESVRKRCAEHHVCPATYYRWEREILGRVQKGERTDRALVAAAPEFTEVSCAGKSVGSGQAVMTVRMDGVAVDIYAGVREEELQAVWRVVKQC